MLHSQPWAGYRAGARTAGLIPSAAQAASAVRSMSTIPSRAVVVIAGALDRPVVTMTAMSAP